MRSQPWRMHLLQARKHFPTWAAGAMGCQQISPRDARMTESVNLLPSLHHLAVLDRHAAPHLMQLRCQKLPESKTHHQWNTSRQVPLPWNLSDKKLIWSLQVRIGHTVHGLYAAQRMKNPSWINAEQWLCQFFARAMHSQRSLSPEGALEKGKSLFHWLDAESWKERGMSGHFYSFPSSL